MTKKRLTIEEIQAQAQANLQEVEDRKEAREQKRQAWIKAQKDITDADLTGQQKREMLDGLQEFVKLGGQAADFQREWPEIRRRLLTDHVSGDPTAGAARRLNF